MRQIVDAISPVIGRLYYELNRHLADHNIMPQAEATLRVRSEFRPDNDEQLLEVFSTGSSRASTSPSRRRGP